MDNLSESQCGFPLHGRATENNSVSELFCLLSWRMEGGKTWIGVSLARSSNSLELPRLDAAVRCKLRLLLASNLR